MRQAQMLSAIALLAAGAAAAQPSVNGDWDGGLKVPAGIELPLTLHLSDAGASLDSPDQNASGVPAQISRQGDKVVVDIPSAHAQFTGTLSADGKSLEGQLVQGGASLPAHFTRRAAGAPPPQQDRPQTPHPPFPYASQDITFKSGDITLAGTLTEPQGPGPFPAVVLLAGSGPENRDETVAGHKIFLVLADHLTRAGIAVLRYDKRGVGASEGAYPTATTTDFAADAEAAAHWLQSQPRIGRLGLIGHSEGAEIAPLVANRDKDVAFVVLLAAPALSGEQTILTQQRAILLASGASPAEADAKGAIEKRLLEAVRAAPDQAAATSAAEKILTESGMPPQAATAQARDLASPWYRQFLDDDPAPALKALRQPTLVVIGSKDLQVTPEANLPIIRSTLAANKAARIVELDGLNHLLQPATTGAPSEYGTIPITMAPAALDLVTGWVLEQAR